MTRVALIVKHFPAPERLSGLVTQARLIADGLSQQVDLHVLCACQSNSIDTRQGDSHYHLHPIPAKGFWLHAPRTIERLKPDTLILLSGIHKAAWIYPAFRWLSSASQNTRRLFIQAVNLDRAPGPWGHRVLQRFDSVLCSSPRSLAQIQRAGLEEQTLYFPPAVDIDAIRKTIAERKSEPLRIGFYNHFNRVKGCDLAAAAFASLDYDDTEFVLAGKGPLQKRLEQICHGKRNLRVMGHLSNPIPGIKACDVMVLPFRTSVSILGISQTVLECLAAGIPVIGTRHEAITAAIEHGKEGLIVDSFDELVAAIRRLHDDTELRQTLSHNAIRKAHDYDISERIEQLLRLI